MWSFPSLLGCAAECGDTGSVCTVAGTGTNGFNGEGEAAAETMLYFPSALARLPDGRLVIDDFNNMLVRVLESDGTLGTLAGSNLHAYAVEGPATESPMENPIDVAVGEDGALYVAEYHAGRVLRVVDGDLTVFAGTGELGNDGDGGAATEARIGEVTGVAEWEGKVVIADEDAACLRVVDGGIISTSATGLVSPGRVRVVHGDVLVVDTGAHQVRTLDGMVVAGTGEPGFSGDGGPAIEAQLASPTSVASDGASGYYVADTGNHVIRRVDASGTITTVLGIPGVPGFDAGIVEVGQAHLDHPADVLPDGIGGIWVADMANGAVRHAQLERVSRR